MPNRQDPETLLIRRQELEAARKLRPPLRSWPSSPRTSSPRMHPPPPPSLALGKDEAPPPPCPGTLTASRLKVTTMLNADELLGITAPDNKPRITLRVRLPDRTISADIAAKSLRKAQATIRETGVDNMVLRLQGRLAAGDDIADAGLSEQPKAAKPKQTP